MYSHSTDCSDTMWPFMVRSCTELLKSTSPSLQNLTVDSAAIFSQNFGTRDEEVWLKSFNLKSFWALKLISLYKLSFHSASNRSVYPFRIAARVWVTPLSLRQSAQLGFTVSESTGQKLINSVSVQCSVVGTKKVRHILSWRKKA